jgi:hypothetical protein
VEFLNPQRGFGGRDFPQAVSEKKEGLASSYLGKTKEKCGCGGDSERVKRVSARGGEAPYGERSDQLFGKFNKRMK